MGRLKDWAIGKAEELMIRDGLDSLDWDLFSIYFSHVCNSKDPDNEPVDLSRLQGENKRRRIYESSNS